MPEKSNGETLSNIINAAFSLFGQYGYEGVSIDRIAKACGLSKGAMYWYFKNKEELYIACVQHLHQIFRHYLFDAMQSESDPIAAIEALFVGLKAMLGDAEIANGIGGYWLDPAKDPEGRIAKAWELAEQEAAQIFLQTFEAGKNSGQYQFEISTEQMSRGLWSVVETSVLPLRRVSPEQAQEMMDVLADTFFRAYSRDFKA